MNPFSQLNDPTFVIWFFLSYLISLVVSMGITALIMVSCWHIFKKLGLPGWKGIIPYYSDYTLFRTVWETKPFWVLVIASGVYMTFSLIMAILLPILFMINGSGSEEEALALLIVFFIIFGALTLALAVLTVVITFKLHIRLARVFGKGVGFAFGLTFISVVFYPILAFGDSQRVCETPVDQKQENSI